MLYHWVYEAYILEVKSTAPKLILNIISCEPPGSDRWSCVGEQVTPPSLSSMLSVTVTKVTLGADLAMMERASAQHVHLLIASTQIRQADRDTQIYPLLSEYTHGKIRRTWIHTPHEYKVPAWEKRTNSLHLVGRRDKSTTGGRLQCPQIIFYDSENNFRLLQLVFFCGFGYHFYQDCTQM